MKKTACYVVVLALALSAAHAFAKDADTPPLRLSPTKIPTCTKAHVCHDLPYGGRQVGKGAVHANVAQTYDLYLPGNIGEIERTAPFYLFVHGGSWKNGHKAGHRAKLFVEMAEQGFTVASMNYVLCNAKRGGAHTFAEMLADIDTELGESIPNFHNMEFRIKQLKDAVQEDKVHRLSKVQDLVNDILKDAEEMCLGERLYSEGKLPKRICHCDTKVNNLLFDEDGNVLCVIDLDTVMPNFIFSDVGDFLRTAANTTNEDDADMNKVSFNMSIFKAFIKGYMETAGSFLLPVEIENIPYAAQLFPYMQAVRFLTDYLNGDTYYKITYPELNLDRTRNQFKLYKSVTEQKDQMAAFIRECLANKS
jgi:serine/threonine protein kinase